MIWYIPDASSKSFEQILRQGEIVKRALIIAAVTAIVLSGCSEPTQTASSAHLTTQASAPVSPQSQVGFSESDRAYLEKLRVEQPRIFTGCAGQGEEQAPRDVKPNLQVVGLAELLPPSTEYPLGVKLYERDGTKLTAWLHTEPGWEDNVTVSWSNTTGIELYSFIIDAHMINFWAQSMQFERGERNENTYGLYNQNTAIGDQWFIMAYNAKEPCAGRWGGLYNKINWTQLFNKQELDLEPRK